MSQRPFAYFDNNATTRVAPEVMAAMTPFFTERWGNASSAYGFGNQVVQDLDRAREQVAALIGAEPGDVLKVRLNKIVPRAYATNFNVPGMFGQFPKDYQDGQVKYLYLDLVRKVTEFLPGVFVPLKIGRAHV